MDAAELPVVSFLTGAPTGATVRLDARVFGAPLRPDIVHRVIVWQQKNARTTAYKTKTRAEVNGGGRKPWKQKGTGRARHGSIRSPIWKGGGRAHGPVLRDWSISLPKRVRRLGLRVALSAKYVDRRLLVVESLAMTAPTIAAEQSGANSSAAADGGAGGALAPIVEGKTRALEALLSRHGLAGKRVVFIDGPGHPPDAFRRAVRNIPRAKPLPATGANVQDIVGAEVLVVTPAAIDALCAHLLQDFFTPAEAAAAAAVAGAGPAAQQHQQLA
jgi:ribosomal protein L4